MDEQNRSRREFIKNLLASGATVHTGLWSSLLTAMSTVVAGDASAQVFTHSFWKKKTLNGVWVWGLNNVGNLGNGNTTSLSVPTQVSTDFIKLSLGNRHFLGIQSDGKLLVSGLNSNGQLGLNNSTNKSAFTQITTGPGSWTQAAAGMFHSLGLDTSGYLWSWGLNADGQMGNGSTTSRSSAVQISAATVWSKISAGDYFSAGITAGKLFTWGDNSIGSLGLGDYSNRNSPVQVMSGTSFNQVSAGSGFCTAITSTGALYGWGAADCHQGYDGTWFDVEYSNTPTAIRNISGSFTQVSSGMNHSLALKTNGTLWAWGNGSFGQLGTLNKIMASPCQLTGTYTLMPNKISGLHFMAVASTGMKASGMNYYGEWGNNAFNVWNSGLVNSPMGTAWSILSCGNHFSLAVDTSYKLWATGNNYRGQLGSGNTTPVSSPVMISAGVNSWTMVSAGYETAAGIQSDGSLWVWGAGNYGVIGNGAENDSTVPVQIAGSWAQVSMGYYHCAAIDSLGRLFAWGLNGDGQLGKNNFTSYSSPVQVAVGGSWTQVCSGGFSMMAIKTDGTLWATGWNGPGNLGDGTTTARRTMTKIGNDSWSQITTGYRHTLGLKTDGTLWGWGYNSLGCLGHTVACDSISSPVQLAGSWTQILAGRDISMGMKSDGTVWTWGANRAGMLGLNINSLSPVQVSGSWTQIYAGAGNSFAIKTDGTFWVWGANANGELGLGDTNPRSSPVQIAGSWSMIPGSGLAGPYMVAKKV